MSLFSRGGLPRRLGPFQNRGGVITVITIMALEQLRWGDIVNRGGNRSRVGKSHHDCFTFLTITVLDEHTKVSCHDLLFTCIGSKSLRLVTRLPAMVL